MNIQTFTQEGDWIQASTEKIANNLYEQIQAKGDANLAVSGGTTPFVIYQELAKQALDFSQVDLIQVDERYVPENNPESNWKNVSKSFEGVDFRQTIRFEYLDQIQDTLALAQAKLPPQLGITILGMGMDGHFASLFAGGEYWDNISNNKALITDAPDNYITQERLSLSPEYIFNSECIIVLLKGEDKYNYLINSLNQNHTPKEFPLQYIVGHPNLVIYCYLD